MTISKLTSGLAIGAAALLISVSGAFAVEAEATGSVNVRTGPGTSYGVVGVLQPGDRVDISRQSGGWCRVALSGPDGWVSCRYLSASNDYYDDDYGRGDRYVRPNVSFSFGFGNYNNRPRHWDGDGHNHGGWNGHHNGPGWNGPGWWMN
jgi:uncharacterized protein YraI